MRHNWEDLIKLAIILGGVAIYVIQLLIRSFARPTAPPEQEPAKPASAAPRALREFIDELRREAQRQAPDRAGERRTGAEPAAAAPPPPAEEHRRGMGSAPSETEKSSSAQRSAPATPPAPVPPPLVELKPREAMAPSHSSTSGRREGAPSAPERPLGSKRRREAAAAPPPPPPVPAVGIHAYIEALARRGSSSESGSGRKGGARSAASKRLGSATAQGRMPKLGITLRDALIAQVVLGPPLCRGGRGVGGARGAGGRLRSRHAPPK